jgi:hypothetical protein
LHKSKQKKKRKKKPQPIHTGRNERICLGENKGVAKLPFDEVIKYESTNSSLVLFIK